MILFLLNAITDPGCQADTKMIGEEFNSPVSQTTEIRVVLFVFSLSTDASQSERGEPTFQHIHTHRYYPLLNSITTTSSLLCGIVVTLKQLGLAHTPPSETSIPLRGINRVAFC